MAAGKKRGMQGFRARAMPIGPLANALREWSWRRLETSERCGACPVVTTPFNAGAKGTQSIEQRASGAFQPVKITGNHGAFWARAALRATVRDGPS